MEMTNSCSVVIPVECLVFNLEFSRVLDMTVYLVPSDTKVLEIYLLKNMKILQDELLYDKA